ncbi:MAG: MopE-related protein [Myxococcota bacterium]
MRWSPIVAILAFSACKGGDNGFVTYDNPPGVSITDPTDGSTYDEGQLVQFAARVSDDGNALTVFWSSDRDGPLAEETVENADSVQFSTASLTPGTHAITLRVVDEAAQDAQASVTVTVEEVLLEPVIAVVHPFSGETGVQGTPFTAQAQVQDAQDDPIQLRVDIDSDVDGPLCTNVIPDLAGIASCAISPSAGVHTLTFTVRDSDGFDATANAIFSVTSSADIDNDGDGFNENQGDCNDSDPTIGPNAVEFLNGRDDDCDGIVDNGTAGYDDDGDGYTEQTGDCNDADPLINPGAVEFGDGVDNDCNGLIDDATDTYDDDGDGFSEAAGDCNDNNININPNASDVPYNGVDEDCDGSDLNDADGDGYVGSVAGGDDCNDNNAAINPGATDNPYNGVDEDCDGSDLRDADGDGYDYDGLSGGTDCDDTDPDINPGESDIPYDGIDQDCDGDDVTDADGDGQDGQAVGGQDCNDADPSIYAGATEVPYDGIDQNCNGTDLVDVDGDGFDGTAVGGTDGNDTNANVNPGRTEIPYNGLDDDCQGGDLLDVDGDGYNGQNGGGNDCNDTNANINPGRTEIPYDGIDQDCSGADLRDVDGDGFDSTTVGGSDCNDSNAAIRPSATETCDGIDNNCTNGVDEIGASGCTTHYIDGDGDGYGSNVSACTCGIDFPYEVTNANDCYDDNGNARPGQTSYFNVHRGDGSFDYNCDNVQSKRWTATNGRCEWTLFDGCDDAVGWSGSNSAACGVNATFIEACSTGWPACTDFDYPRTQECR